MRTFYPNGKEATALSQGPWHLVDANGQVLGRLATRVARLLIGKHKVRFTPSDPWDGTWTFKGQATYGRLLEGVLPKTPRTGPGSRW